MSKSIKLKNNTYIDSSSIIHNKVLLSDMLDIKYITSGGWSMNTTVDKDCYADVEFSFNGWCYGGGELAFKVKCSSGETILQQIARISGNDTVPRRVTARSIFKLTAGNSYTFSLDILKGSLGSDTDICWIGVLINK